MMRLVALLFCANVLANEAPPKLSETGWSGPAVFAYSVQYPLWSDGAAKKRWAYFPPGEKIDTRDMDRWVFPPGTKLWKEFSLDGKRIETRYLEKKADRTWIFATYEWKGADAFLVADEGKKDVHPTSPTTSHDIPSLNQCRFCHSRGGDPVEGFDAVQLGPVVFRSLADQGLLSAVPAALLLDPPKIHATTEVAREAIGYLHGNCGGCHNPEGRAGFTGLYLRHAESDPEPVVSTAVDQETSMFSIPGQDVSYRIRSGNTAASAVFYRMSATLKNRMPPVGRELADPDGVRKIERWIHSLR